jgi:hypothetical protein
MSCSVGGMPCTETDVTGRLHVIHSESPNYASKSCTVGPSHLMELHQLSWFKRHCVALFRAVLVTSFPPHKRDQSLLILIHFTMPSQLGSISRPMHTIYIQFSPTLRL